jgi:hypothetical protein
VEFRLVRKQTKVLKAMRQRKLRCNKLLLMQTLVSALGLPQIRAMRLVPLKSE